MLTSQKRHLADRQVNKSKSQAIRDGVLKEILWSEVVVGDILKVEQDQAFPADMICLVSSELGGLCYIETSQLDGETNLKIRRSLPVTSDLYTVDSLTDVKATITCQQPNNQLYKFLGTIRMEAGVLIDEDEKTVPVEVEQILLRGAVLKNTTHIFGVVVYTGSHTKLMMNSEEAPHKKSRVEILTNYMITILFALEVLVTVACAIGIGVWQYTNPGAYYVLPGIINSAVITGLQGLVTFFILFNNFIPISLYVSMEFVKMLQARWILDKDIDIYYEPADIPASAKTSSLNEELGQVEYIFSDKTGTLTQNVMEFLKFSVNGVEYGRGTTEIGRAAAKRNGIDLHDDRPLDWIPSKPGFNFYDERIIDRAFVNEPHVLSIVKFFTLLAVCHTVIPEIDKKNPNELFYQAASPDEGALVRAAADLGFVFKHRTPTSCTIEADGVSETYEVLNVLEFNSTRKRMSVIVRTQDQRILLMTKGADNVIFKLLKPGQPYLESTQENLRKFAEEGLRTLVCAQVELDPIAYGKWNRDVFDKANTSLTDKEEAVAAAAEEVEKNLTLIGASAIEDKLQDGVPDTISDLARAGIKIWVLTGDKQETAINIGFACALLDNNMGIIVLNDSDRASLKKEIREKLDLAQRGLIENKSGIGVVIDGSSLELVLQSNEDVSSHEPTLEEKIQQRNTSSSPSGLSGPLEEPGEEDVQSPLPSPPTVTPLSNNNDGVDVDLPGEEKLAVTFLKLCMYCKSVICCRVSPLQKALVVKLVKNNLDGAITLSIGDGANDVSMIQAAHIGIGISGQEGLQAARASDYAIGQFRYLKKLLLVHGRYNYRRIARLICYSFYKNLTLQLCQFWFVFYNAYTGASVYDSLLLSLYNIVFTSIPIMAFGLFDRDVSIEASMNIPQLFSLGQRGHYFDIRVFVGWLFTSAWHSVCCFFIPYYSLSTLYNGAVAEFSYLSYIVYTSVITVVSLKVALESASMTVFNYLSVYGSILSWFVVANVYSVLWLPIGKAPLSPSMFEFFSQLKYAYFEFFNAAGNPLFWAICGITIGIALVKDLLTKSVVHNVKINLPYVKNWLRLPYHVIQDTQRKKGVKFDEESFKNICPEIVDLKPPERRLKPGVYLSLPGNPSPVESPREDERTRLNANVTAPYDSPLASHRGSKKTLLQPLDFKGYSFSQTEGGQAEALTSRLSGRSHSSSILNVTIPSDNLERDDLFSLGDESNYSLASDRD
ncbi:phospholipid-transporting ATPase [Acrasis kona]|uniref:Phospholipid-transporting ATPase n=1 Tax=Acrasis kona TaxID=1008807 RepID=A0AAW2YJF5_9EUKA